MDYKELQKRIVLEEIAKHDMKVIEAPDLDYWKTVKDLKNQFGLIDVVSDVTTSIDYDLLVNKQYVGKPILVKNSSERFTVLIKYKPLCREVYLVKGHLISTLTFKSRTDYQWMLMSVGIGRTLEDETIIILDLQLEKVLFLLQLHGFNVTELKG